MANWIHCALLSIGVGAWNKWRETFPHIEPDLSGANLNGTNLSKANLKGANLGAADLFEANLSGADLTGAYLGGAFLTKANLSEASLAGAFLRGTDLTRANLTGANLAGSYLSRADFSGAFLRMANLSGADLTGAFLRGAYLTGTFLKGAFLSRADFTGAHLRGANLSEADLTAAFFSSADLTAAFLIRTQALYANFNNAIFTGACIEDWNINNATQLDSITCDYIYLQYYQQERRPTNGKFASGEFTKLFQKVFETVELIFLHGIEWQAFSTALEKLRSHVGGDEISIQAIEQRPDDAFIIRLKVPTDANKVKIEKYLKLEYERALLDIDEKYRDRLQAKANGIAIYRLQGANLMEIAKTMASRPIDFETIATAESGHISELREMESENENGSSVGFNHSQKNELN